MNSANKKVQEWYSQIDNKDYIIQNVLTVFEQRLNDLEFAVKQIQNDLYKPDSPQKPSNVSQSYHNNSDEDDNMPTTHSRTNVYNPPTITTIKRSNRNAQ